jgi:hypothetical protein
VRYLLLSVLWREVWSIKQCGYKFRVDSWKQAGKLSQLLLQFKYSICLQSRLLTCQLRLGYATWNKKKEYIKFTQWSVCLVKCRQNHWHYRCHVKDKITIIFSWFVPNPDLMQGKIVLLSFLFVRIDQDCQKIYKVNSTFSDILCFPYFFHASFLAANHGGKQQRYNEHSIYFFLQYYTFFWLYTCS